MTHEDAPLPKTINSFKPHARNSFGIPIEDDASWKRKRKNFPTVGRRRRTGVNRLVIAATGIGLTALGATWVANSPLNIDGHPGVTEDGKSLEKTEKDSLATHFNTGDLKIAINKATIRTSPYIAELDQETPANTKKLSNIKSINGIPVKDIKANDFLLVKNAKVNDNGGTVPDIISSNRWIEIDIVDENNKEEKGYISDGYSTRNKNIISTLKPGTLEKIVKDASGNMLLPSDGFNYTEIISSSQTSSK